MPSCCSLRGSSPSPQETDLLLEATSEGNLQTRPVKPECAKNFFKITFVVGVIIGFIGGLAVVSLLLPNAGSLTPLFQHTAKIVTRIALKLGTEAMPMAVFVASVGGTAFFAGAVGWAVEGCKLRERREPENLRIVEEDGEEIEEPSSNATTTQEDKSNGQHNENKADSTTGEEVKSGVDANSAPAKPLPVPTKKTD